MGTGVIDDKTFFYEPSLQGAIFPGIPETSRINIINNYMEIYDDEFLRISTLPYDLIGLINFIYTKEYKLVDVIKLLNNPNKKFDGIDGNYYFKNKDTTYIVLSYLLLFNQSLIKTVNIKKYLSRIKLLHLNIFI